MTTIPRRAALSIASVLTATALAACGGSPSGSSADSSGGSSSNITIGLVQGQDFVHAMPARVAAAQGLFSKEGLNVKIVAFTSGSDLIKAMAGGSVDVGAATGLDAVSATAKGVPLQAFYGVESKIPMALIVPKTSTVSTFADLKDKKVGISKVGSFSDFTLRAALATASLNVEDVTEVPLGDPASTIAAMERGDVDGFILPVNFGYLVEAKGTGKIATMATDVLGANTQFAVLMAKKDYISQNPATLKKLASAYTASLTWMAANKDATLTVAEKELKMSAPIATKTYDGLVPLFTPDGALNAAGMKAYADALPKLGISRSVPSESDYLTTTVTGK